MKLTRKAEITPGFSQDMNFCYKSCKDLVCSENNIRRIVCEMFFTISKKAFVSGIMAYSLQFSIGPALCKSVFSAALQKYTEKKNTQGSIKNINGGLRCCHSRYLRFTRTTFPVKIFL